MGGDNAPALGPTDPCLALAPDAIAVGNLKLSHRRRAISTLAGDHSAHQVACQTRRPANAKLPNLINAI